MEREAQSDIKKLIDKGTPSSAMMALGRIFSQFFKKFPSADLPDPMSGVMRKYIKEDVFKYAKLSPNVKLKNFLERYQKEVGNLEEVLPGAASKHFMNLLKSVSTPAAQKAQPKPQTAKPGGEPVFEPKPGKKPQETPGKEPAMDEKGAISSLTQWLKKNHYRDLWPKLPTQVQRKLDSVGLAPLELKIASVSGLRVARRFMESL